ncbi:rho GTPase-activating protein 27 [Chanos chanos]|uniref:Rho GTPase-activating protein 27 n=1 Tax=Chanos chanos TaxID=29144 RepID=A0A6J2WYH6_CHACN|nr:rho GTPase-activating protein 27-like [Chanos chanos]
MGEAIKMPTQCSLGLVLVEFEYEYTGRDGHLVSIKPNERYILLAKTNDHWWHVRKDIHAKPFYIPAKYVKELPADFPSPLDFSSPPSPEPRPTVNLSKENKSDEVTIRLRSSNNYHKTENRMSTFGVPLDIHDSPPFNYGGRNDSVMSLHSHSAAPPPSEVSQQKKRPSLTHNTLFGPRSAPAEEASNKSRAPSFSPADPLHKPTQAKPVVIPTVKDVNKASGPQGKPSEPPLPLELPKEPNASRDPTPSPESENIYESIIDLNLDEPSPNETALNSNPSPVTEPSSTSLSSSPSQSKLENASPNTAVYANVTDLKKTTPRPPISSTTSSCSSTGTSLSPLPLDTEGWEVHTDQDSGKEFYFQRSTGQTTWTDPRSPPPSAGMESMAPIHPEPSPASTPDSDWEQVLDETSGRHYYYNPTSGQTSWSAPDQATSPNSSHPEENQNQSKKEEDGPPPLPEEDYPMDDLDRHPNSPILPKDFQLPPIKTALIPRANLDPAVPVGWTRSLEPDGKTIFTSERTHEQWIQSVDEKGKPYYYLRDGSKSQWNLPEAPAQPSQPPLGNGVDQDKGIVLKNWRHTMSSSQFNASQEDMKFHPTHRRNVSDYTSDVSSSGNSPEMHHPIDRVNLKRNLSNRSSDSHHGGLLEKAGILNKTKVAEHGKKLRKNWTQSWTVLHGGVLTFHKDPKSTPAGTASKTNQIVPEYTVELRGATITWATKDKSSKKHVLELKTRHGSEYLIQYDTESIINDWYKIIVDTIKQLDFDHYSEEEEDEVLTDKQPFEREDKDKKRSSTRQSAPGATDSEQGRVRTKLRKFLQRRPTYQAVKEKGYIKDNVFGCHLDVLCHRENTTVPRFVEKCIKAVEKRGLDIDGIYRVSGNLAVIQKLRHKADHEENLDLDDGQWEEIHVITGALKLFLRELPEPLFPYSFFDKFIAAIQVSDYNQRVSYMFDLVRSLPLPNHNTMEVLFRHLRKVISHGESNRMSVQSTAIVFGPTLLRPQEESNNIAVYMVFQNQIVELILNEFEKIFLSRSA